MIDAAIEILPPEEQDYRPEPTTGTRLAGLQVHTQSGVEDPASGYMWEVIKNKAGGSGDNTNKEGAPMKVAKMDEFTEAARDVLERIAGNFPAQLAELGDAPDSAALATFARSYADKLNQVAAMAEQGSATEPEEPPAEEMAEDLEMSKADWDAMAARVKSLEDNAAKLDSAIKALDKDVGDGFEAVNDAINKHIGGAQ